VNDRRKRVTIEHNRSIGSESLGSDRSKHRTARNQETDRYQDREE
jgi:hypothetical protein